MTADHTPPPGPAGPGAAGAGGPARSGVAGLGGPARRLWQRIWGRSLRGRLLRSYLAITLLAVATADVLALTALTRSALAERRETLVGHGRVVAGVSARYMLKGHDYLESIARDYGQQAGVRVLILDGQGQVLRDSFYDPAVLGANLANRPEVAAALRGQAATRMEAVPGVGRTLYAAVPVRDLGQVVGAVLVAQSVEPVFAHLAGIRRVLLLVSAAALALAAGAAWLLASSLAGPVATLTEAVRGIQAGDLSRRVPVTGEDELGRLAAAFNGMADQLARLEESRRAFIANAAHELRTPLAALRALTEPLLSGAVTSPEEQGEFLRDLGREVDRLADLAGDLLTLSELEAGRPLPKEPVHLAALVAGVVERLQPLARERGVHLALSGPAATGLEEEALTVMADRRKLERAIYNLVHNGIQYNGPGGRVTVAVAPEPGAVRITVADTGPGIPPEDLPYIFDRFYRREPSRSRGHGGAGLGLAIAREIVESHLGAIQVESRPGEGTRFAVVLPRS